MAETAISVYSHMTGEMECNAAKKMDDALGRVTRYFYDQKKGHLLAVISPDGNGTSYTHDSLGRMTLAVPAKVNSSGTGYTQASPARQRRPTATTAAISSRRFWPGFPMQHMSVPTVFLLCRSRLWKNETSRIQSTAVRSYQGARGWLSDLT